MKIALGKGESQEPFRFIIGDTVITRTSRNIGTVVSGICFNATKPDRVFYQIKLLENGQLWTVMEDTIEPYPDTFPPPTSPPQR